MRNNAVLRDLSDWYRDWSHEQGLRHQVLYENKGPLFGLIVDKTSANPGLLGVKPIPVDATHRSITKPRSSDDVVYVRIRAFLDQEVLVPPLARLSTADARYLDDIQRIVQQTQEMRQDLTELLDTARVLVECLEGKGLKDRIDTARLEPGTAVTDDEKFPAEELNEYLEDLRAAAELVRDRRWNEAEAIINRLFSAPFTWTHGMTLHDYVSALVQSRAALGQQLPRGLSIEQVVKEVKLLLPLITAEALDESIRTDLDENILRALHPNTAIAIAVDVAVSR